MLDNDLNVITKGYLNDWPGFEDIEVVEVYTAFSRQSIDFYRELNGHTSVWETSHSLKPFPDQYGSNMPWEKRELPLK